MRSQASSTIELQTFNDDPDASATHLGPASGNFAAAPQRQDFSLPPVDTGRSAWLFLCAAFMMEALVWGWPFAFGIFQEYYSTHAPFEGSQNIAVIGTCSMGVMYLGAPLVFAALQRYPRIQQWSTPAGLLTMCLALTSSSFATNTTQLIATQGVLYAIGGSFAYSPCILFMDEWFVKRRGFAYGVMWAGTGLAGVVLPILMQWLLDTYGHKTALRAWSIILFLMVGPLLHFVKPRVPISPHTVPKRLDLRWIYSKTFGLLQICNIIEALGFFIPSIYLPSYARDLGGSSFESALAVILLNVASVFGCIAMGTMTDRLHVTTCIMLSTIGSTLSAFFIWGFSINLPTLFVFSILYGLFAGSFTSTWPGIMREVKKQQETADPLMVFAMLAAGRGIGNVISGPLSEALKQGGRLASAGASGYGTDYGTLIIFTGITACLGGASILGRPWGWV